MKKVLFYAQLSFITSGACDFQTLIDPTILALLISLVIYFQIYSSLRVLK